MVAADLELQSPSGGLVRLIGDGLGDLYVDCERSDSLWDAFDLLRELGLADLNATTLQRLRSPLLQTVHVRVGEREVLEWPPGKLPKIKSARGMLDLFRSR